jgi:hypothetical protein
MPFKPGQSGNPAGKKAGTRHRATQLAQALIFGHAAEIWRGVIDRAVAGDPAMVKLCLERIVPRRRGQPVNLDRFLTRANWDLCEAQLLIANEMLDGSIAPDEALALSEIVGGIDGVSDDELHRRLAELEPKPSPFNLVFLPADMKL